MLPEFKNILFATGLGSGSPYVFRYALSLARQYQANLVIVHGIETITPYTKGLLEQNISDEHSKEMYLLEQKKAKSAINERLVQLCATECSDAGECQKLVESIRVVDGDPFRVILDTAEECGTDLIVMGAHRHTAVGEVLVGSTTRKVLQNARLPVLVVRIPEGYSEQL